MCALPSFCEKKKKEKRYAIIDIVLDDLSISLHGISICSTG